MGFAPIGIKLIAGGVAAAALGGVLMAWSRWAGVPVLFLGLAFASFSAYFFRDPERERVFAPGEIACPADGTVMTVDNNDLGTRQKRQYGRYVLIKHDNNLSTLYAHLSRQVVARGATVKRGDLIGYSGNTGYSTGPHIHLTVYWAPSVQMKSVPPAAGLVPVGVTIDPNDYL